jgi:hypothetical protein
LARPTPPHSPVNRVRVVGRTNAESSKGWIKTPPPLPSVRLLREKSINWAWLK